MSDSFATLWTIAHQAPLSMGFSRQKYWSRLNSSSKEFSQPRSQTQVSYFAGGFFTAEPPGNPILLYNPYLFLKTSLDSTFTFSVKCSCWLPATTQKVSQHFLFLVFYFHHQFLVSAPILGLWLQYTLLLCFMFTCSVSDIRITSDIPLATWMGLETCLLYVQIWSWGTIGFVFFLLLFSGWKLLSLQTQDTECPPQSSPCC